MGFVLFFVIVILWKSYGNLMVMLWSVFEERSLKEGEVYIAILSMLLKVRVIGKIVVL